MARNLVRVGDKTVGSGYHGYPCCGHTLTGFFVQGAPSVLTNGRPTVRVGDRFVHNCPHCGTGIAVGAIPNVVIEGQPQHPLGGAVNFTCGVGITVSASTDTV